MCQHHFVLLAREHDYHLMENFGCLFSTVEGFNIKSFIRSGVTDDELREQLITLWNVRDDRYSDERTEQTVKIDNARKLI